MKPTANARSLLLMIAACSIGHVPTLAAAKNTTERTIDAAIPAVAATIEPTFRELKIAKVDGSTLVFYAMAVGKASTGSRVVVSITGAGKDKSKVTVTTDTPRNEELEAKVLATMTSKTGK